jgi:hypothetical protein
MAYKNRTYIAFDGDSDIRYYWLMKAWKHNSKDFFVDFNINSGELDPGIPGDVNPTWELAA